MGTVRRLVVAWQHPDARMIDPVGVLDYDGGMYTFGYIVNALEVADFRPFLGFPHLDRVYKSRDLFPIFAQRVMDARRPDYHRYVERLGLDEDEASPWEQIARSQGRRQGDSIQLLPQPVNLGGTITGLFLVNGVRWVPGTARQIDGRTVEVTSDQVNSALAALRPGDPLSIAREADNPVNQLALMVLAGHAVPVGWVPNLMLEDFHRLMDIADVTITAEHINPPDAPSHLRLLARMTVRGAGSYRFYSGPRWQLIANGRNQ